MGRGLLPAWFCDHGDRMRQVLIGDIIAAARSLLEVPPCERTVAAAAMLYRAHVADKVTKRTGLPHKTWGNGSLMAAALPRPNRAEPFLTDAAYLEAVHFMLGHVIAWKRANRALIRRHGA